MKRISTIILIFLLMAISFVGIGLLILYVSGTVTTLDEARGLVTGEIVAIRQPAEDGVELLERQKSEIGDELARTQRTIAALKSLSDSLLSLTQTPPDAIPEPDLVRVSNLLAGMDDVTAAKTLVSLGADLALKLVSRMQGARAAQILEAIDDEPTRTNLIKAMTGK